MALGLRAAWTNERISIRSSELPRLRETLSNPEVVAEHCQVTEDDLPAFVDEYTRLLEHETLSPLRVCDVLQASTLDDEEIFVDPLETPLEIVDDLLAELSS